MTRSLASQIAAVRHCIASADVNDDVRANAEAGLHSLEWIERNVDIIREVQRLMTESPVIITFLREFKGAQIKHPDEVSHASKHTVTGGS
jgi:hypothetical protein